MEDYAVLRERDVVLLGVVPDWGFVEELSWEIEQEISSCVWQSFRQYFGGFYSVAAQGLEGLHDSPRGRFSGFGHFRKAFWVFLGFLSRGGFQSFNIF